MARSILIPELPRFVAPMLAKRGAPFDSSEHLFEIKWDGTRVLAFVESHSYRLVNHRDAKNPGSLRQGDIVVDDRLAVKIRDAKEHLGLKIDLGDDTVVRGQQPLFAAFEHGLFLLLVV